MSGQGRGAGSRWSALALKLESDRMIYLDLLRVASSYLIIVYHFQNQMMLGSRADRVHAVLAPFTLAVDLFFFISGFVIASVYAGRIGDGAGFRDFMVKRLARLGPLHWATFGAFALLGLLAAAGRLPTNHPELYDPRCAVPNLLLLHAFGLCRSLTYNYVSWSISAEMGMYLLFPLLMPLAARRGWGLLVALSLVAALTAAARADPSWLEWSFDGGVLRAIPSFLLGAVAYRERGPLARVPHAAGWLAVACMLFLASCWVGVPKLMLLPLVYALGALGVAASERLPGAAARRLAPLGQLTYSLYMLHPLVQTVVLTGIGRTALKLAGWRMDLFVVAVAALMIPIAWTSLVLFERPARRWLTRRLAARPAQDRPAPFTADSRW